MQIKQITIGETVAYGARNGLVKAEVTEKAIAVRFGSWTSDTRKSGVRIKRIDGAQLPKRAAVPGEGIADSSDDGVVVQSRDLSPWEGRHDRRLEREKEQDAREDRNRRVGERLGISVLTDYDNRVRISEADFFDLALRLGVGND